MASAPIAAVAHSSIVSVHHVERLDETEVSRVVTALAQEKSDATCVVIGNTDALISVLSHCKDTFPENCICPIPNEEAIRLVSDKATFAKLCAEHGLDTPLTEVVSLAGTDKIAPTAIPFPLVAKRAPALPSMLASSFMGLKMSLFHRKAG